jgi:23S rRNA pseudouridine2604 synthase
VTEPVRLAKRVAALVPCSRREAEQYIEQGCVRVDGRVIEEPQFRVCDERVEIDAGARAAPVEPVTLLLHKPAGASHEDALRLLVRDTRAPDDASGIRTVNRHFSQLIALMPLPAQASGLAVFSQERGVVRKLTQDEADVEQELVAHVAGRPEPDALLRLGHGLTYEGRALPPVKVSWQSEARLRFAMKGVAPQRVPWMCEQVGLRVIGLKRIRLGRVPMAGLPPGRWRYLRAGERF